MNNTQVEREQKTESFELIIGTTIVMILTMSVFTKVIMETKEIGLWDYLIAGAGFLCFGASAVFFSLRLNNEGAVKNPKPFLRMHTVLSILAIIFFIVALFIGMAKPDTIGTKINQLNRLHTWLQTKKEFSIKEIQSIEHELNKITGKMDEIKKAPKPNP